MKSYVKDVINALLGGLASDIELLRNSTKTNMLKQALLLVLFPLLVGAAIYRFFRPKRAAFFGDGATIELPIPALILHSLPSLLWSFAMASALILVWHPKAKAGVWLLGIIASVVSLLFEAWQAADFGIGTFDWNDCLFSVTGCLFSLLVFQKMMVHENHD
ncbi:MAG: hypothetical protein IPM82_22305 [Saprospiraceae bacterium]|nr:hypothetical protein [Saprospiraceae bacterium]